jgi:hypothetical protein
MAPQLYVEPILENRWPSPPARSHKKSTGRVEKPHHKKDKFARKPWWKEQSGKSSIHKQEELPTKKNGLSQCWYCTKPWSHGHRCKEYLERTEKQESSFKKARAARIKKGMDSDDIDEAMGTLNMHSCKSLIKKEVKKEKENNPVLKNGSFIVPISIESHSVWALIDSGSNFSSLDKSFVQNKNIPFVSITGSIALAQKDHTSQRIGITNATKVSYNQKTLTADFEIMELPTDENYVCVIGTDLFEKLGIALMGLAVSHHDKPPLQFDDDERKDIPEADNSPAGTDEEQQAFHSSVKNSMRQNQLVDKKSFCMVPESVVTLDTHPGKTCYKRQYPIADVVSMG